MGRGGKGCRGIGCNIKVLGPHPQGIRMKAFKEENKKIQDRAFCLL